MKKAPNSIPSDVNLSSGNYRQIFEESPAPMYIFEVHTFEFLAVNEAALNQYGYSREEFLTMNATQIRPQQEIDLLKKTIYDGPHVTYFDYGRWKHIRKNGEVFFVHIYAHASLFQGKTARFVMAIDIDAKVKAEAALLEKNAEITDILESITDGFYAMNERWEVTYMNREAERILKCKREELIGKNLWDFFPLLREGKFYAEYQRALKNKISVHFEDCYVALGVWGSMRVYPTKEGLAVYFVDITEQKKIREKIFNDDQNLRAIINNTKDIIWSVDRDNNIISANEAFISRMKYISGKKITQFNRADFEEILYNQWQEYFQRAFAGESYKIIWKEQMNGQDIFEEVSFNPILDQENQVIGISCFSRDITEQYTHTQMIEQQNEQLRKISLIQSHEVRGPLSSILGLVQLFKDSEKDSPDGEIIDLLGKAAERLDAVIRKITAQAQ